MKQKFFGKVGQQGKLFTGKEVEGLVKNAILNERVSLANDYIDLAFKCGETQGYSDGYKKGVLISFISVAVITVAGIVISTLIDKPTKKEEKES